jgi:nicotinamide phosphoribosyltransferase
MQLKTPGSLLKTSVQYAYLSNLAFGMGGALLQKVNRDTMSFATKLCYVESTDGSKRDVMKCPKTDKSKWSLPGEFKVIRNGEGLPVVYPKESKTEGENILRVVYDKQPVTMPLETFSAMKIRIEREWKKSPKVFNPISADLQAKMERTVANVSNVNKQ